MIVQMCVLLCGHDCSGMCTWLCWCCKRCVCESLRVYVQVCVQVCEHDCIGVWTWLYRCMHRYVDIIVEVCGHYCAGMCTGTVHVCVLNCTGVWHDWQICVLCIHGTNVHVVTNERDMVWGSILNCFECVSKAKCVCGEDCVLADYHMHLHFDLASFFVVW